jgi:hypothetical protein
MTKRTKSDPLPTDGLIRTHFDAGKSTGQIAKELGVGRDVVASARGRIFEGNRRDTNAGREDNRRARPTETIDKVTMERERFVGMRQLNMVISLPRIKSLHGEFKDTSNG